MDSEKMGNLIRALRQTQQMTQKQLADRLELSDKTVSKWERGCGCPDLAILPELARVLGVRMESLLDGELPESDHKGGSMKKVKFYVCPRCGNVSLSSGGAVISCCGRMLEPLDCSAAAEADQLTVEPVEDEWFISSAHPMTKENYISFLAYAAGDSVLLCRQYPEWPVQVRIPRRGHGILYWYSAGCGLRCQRI